MIVREYEEDEITVQRVPLIMAGALIATVLAFTLLTSFGVFERQSIPSEARAEAGSMSVATRSLFFFDESDGTVRVEDAETRATIARYGPGAGGFVRSTLRSLVHQRRINAIGPEIPFELIEWDNGGITLMDSTTGESLELSSFGGDNQRTFAVMLNPQLDSERKMTGPY